MPLNAMRLCLVPCPKCSEAPRQLGGKSKQSTRRDSHSLKHELVHCSPCQDARSPGCHHTSVGAYFSGCPVTFNKYLSLIMTFTFHSCNPTSCSMLSLYVAVMHRTFRQIIPSHRHRMSWVLDPELNWNVSNCMRKIEKPKHWWAACNWCYVHPIHSPKNPKQRLKLGFCSKTLHFSQNCYGHFVLASSTTILPSSSFFIHHPYLQPAVLTHHQNVDHVISSLTSSSLSWLPGRAWLQDQAFWSGQLRSKGQKTMAYILWRGLSAQG